MQKPLKSVDNQSDWIIIGRFGRPQGLKGFVRVISFTDPTNNILDYTPWYVNVRGLWNPVKLVSVETHTKFILVQVDGHLQREQASALTNCDIAIEHRQLPKLPTDDYYWHELIGMQVINKDGCLLGTVTEILATGSNDVLVIMGEKRHLVPYLPGEFVTQVDVIKRIIDVDWDLDF